MDKNKLLAQLHSEVEEKHQKALAALEVIRQYLDGSLEVPGDPLGVKDDAKAPLAQEEVVTPPGANGKASVAPAKREWGHGEKIEAILECIHGSWMSVEEISQLTKIDQQHIRQRLYHPFYAKMVDKVDNDGVMRFRLKEGVEV